MFVSQQSSENITSIQRLRVNLKTNVIQGGMEKICFT